MFMHLLFAAQVAAGQELLSNEQAQDANGKFFVKLRGKFLDECVEGGDLHKASWELELWSTKMPGAILGCAC
jgi:hypothetical protein